MYGKLCCLFVLTYPLATICCYSYVSLAGCIQMAEGVKKVF